MVPNVSLWIVTYKNSEDLHNNIESLLDTVDQNLINLDINIINNHTQFHLLSKFSKRVKVWDNILRSDLSLGHLSRNYNQALIHGFQDLNKPVCDYVITSQDDEIWQPNWCEWFLEQMKSYTFVTHRAGDGVVCYSASAVKKIGLWDERFSPSFYHEGDYFLRALMYNKNESSINDYEHGRVLNPVDKCLVEWPAPNNIRQQEKNRSMQLSKLPFSVWQHKWSVSPIHWSRHLIDNPPYKSRCVNYIIYPHFEMAVENLAEKNFII